MKGGLMILATPKGSAKEKGPVEEEVSSAEEDYAREAFSAVKGGDQEGFVQAFLGAVRACAGKAKAGGYEDDEEEDRSEGF